MDILVAGATGELGDLIHKSRALQNWIRFQAFVVEVGLSNFLPGAAGP